MTRNTFLRRVLPALLTALLGACASYSGSSLVPGQSTEAQVRAVMGTPAMERAGAGGERVLWYPRLPFGRESYAARIGPDGRLIGLEQRLTEENIARLRPNESTVEDVLDLLGPPNEVYAYPRMQREAWEYQLRTPPAQRTLYVQLSPDRVVREIYQLHDRDLRGPFIFMGP